MTLKETAYQMEALQIEAEKIHSMGIAIYEAIYRSEHAISTYEWAFCAFSDMTFSLKNGLAELTDCVYESLQTEKIEASETMCSENRERMVC